MPGTGCFSAYGTTFRLRASERRVWSEALARVRALGWRDTAAGDVDVDYHVRGCPSRDREPGWAFEIECNGAPVGRAADLQGLLDRFEDHAKIETAWRARDHLLVHAGAVGWRGRGIVLPGRSGTGKTTLVRALLRAGAEYYSDEFAVLDARGRVHPCPVPLSIRGSGPRPARVHTEALGARVATVPAPVSLIVVTEYRSRARWRPRALSRGEALLALMANTVAARQPPDRTMPILRATVLRARAIESRRGEAQAVVGRVLVELV